MQETPEPQDAARAAGSADFTHYGDYLGYAGDLGYENRIVAEEPETAAGEPQAASEEPQAASGEPTESAEQAEDSAANNRRLSGPPSPRTAADNATSADAIEPRPQRAATTV